MFWYRFVFQARRVRFFAMRSFQQPCNASWGPRMGFVQAGLPGGGSARQRAAASRRRRQNAQGSEWLRERRLTLIGIREKVSSNGQGVAGGAHDSCTGAVAHCLNAAVTSATAAAASRPPAVAYCSSCPCTSTAALCSRKLDVLRGWLRGAVHGHRGSRCVGYVFTCCWQRAGGRSSACHQRAQETMETQVGNGLITQKGLEEEQLGAKAW